MSHEHTFRSLTIDYYDQVHDLRTQTEGISLNESDSKEAIAPFLERNPGLSLVVQTTSGEIAGAVLCGHDGRRGYLHHLAVKKFERGHGLGAELVNRCLARLSELGIRKTNIFLFADHTTGRSFCEHQRWCHRVDLLVMQRGESNC